MTANCDICGQPVTTEFTARNGKLLHVSCLFREWCRLQQFRDAVLAAMTAGEPADERKDGGK